MKKVIIFILISLMVFSTSVYAENIYDVQQDKAWVDSKLKDVNKEIDKKQELVDIYGKMIESQDENLNQQEELLTGFEDWVVALKEEIDAQTQAIIESEIRYAEKLNLLKERIVEAYVNSGINLLDIISKAEDINKIFEEIEVRKYLNEYDKKLLQELVSLKLDLEDKRITAENMKYSYEIAIADTKTAMENMSKIKAIAEETVNSASDSLEELLRKQNALEAESAALMNEIIKLQSKAKYIGGKMLWPLPANRKIPTGGGTFGMRIHPIFKDWRMHTGIDLGAPYNANILAANDGVVLKAGYSSGYGNRIVIDHGGGIATLYAHATTLLVHEGDKISQGQVIALVGSTGNSTGPHLHFEVIVNGVQVDPMNYLDPSR
ncbi:MAG: peptidoglycan DD-metalloendopeptidase family protein [Clostridia bacterium]|nr:peptidoglycan DD-metalloendopeptidase family protein [Clostridia bacterium]